MDFKHICHQAFLLYMLYFSREPDRKWMGYFNSDSEIYVVYLSYLLKSSARKLHIVSFLSLSRFVNTPLPTVLSGMHSRLKTLCINFHWAINLAAYFRCGFRKNITLTVPPKKCIEGIILKIYFPIFLQRFFNLTYIFFRELRKK